MQKTLNELVTLDGVGLHSGKPARLVLNPAPAGHGIVFRRSDLADNNEIAALWSNVNQEPLNTRLVNEAGVSVATIEHLMAALAGTGINNVLVEIDGPEVPILDGSAAPFVKAIMTTGIKRQPAPLRVIEVLDTIEVSNGDAVARLSPATSLQIDFSIEFPDEAIGAQAKQLNMANGAFVRELCDSRTFCRNSDVIAMHEAGLALGGSLENAVVVEGDQVLTPGGLRHDDEAVRHKMLDALGDLYTAGAPIIGRYTGVRAGHALTNKLLRAMFDTPGAWRWVHCDATLSSRLPGVGVRLTDLAAVA